MTSSSPFAAGDRLAAQPLLMIWAADFIGASYANYVRDYRVLVRAQVAVHERFGFDVLSCCSDAWREVADCGAELVFPAHQPPYAARHPVSNAADLARLTIPDPAAGGRMTDRLEAVRALRTMASGRVPVLGWIEGPIACAVNLVGMTTFMRATRRDPALATALLDFAVELERRFALAQVAAGADMVGLGDAAASLVHPDYYAAEIAPREQTLVTALHAAGVAVRLHICGDVRGKFAAMAATRADLIDVDYPQTITAMRTAVGPDVWLAGNLNPVEQVLRSTPARIAEDLGTCSAEAGPRYVVAAGCEIPPGTPVENVSALAAFAGRTRAGESDAACT